MGRDGFATLESHEGSRRFNIVNSWDRAALHAARSLVVLSLLYATWRFGAVQSHVIRDVSAMLAAAAIAMLAAPSTWRRETRIPVALPGLAFAFIVYAWLQLGPLPKFAEWGGFAQPQHAANEVSLINEAVSQLGGDVVGEATRSGSVAPEQSRIALIPFALAFVVLVLSSATFRSKKSRRFYVWLLVANGAVLSLWAIVQRLNDNRELLPGVDHEGSAVPFAGFVYKNAGAASVLVALALAAAHLLVRRRESSGSMYRRATRWATIPGVSMTVFAALLVTGVLISYSRGAWVAAIVAVVAVASRRNLIDLPRRAQMGITVSCVALVAIVTAVGVSSVARNADRLNINSVLADGRWAHWRDGWRTAIAHLPFGSGLGTYGYATLPYESDAYSSWFRHAHNQYLEFLVELGMPGILLVVVALVWLGRETYRVLRNASRTEHRRWAMVMLVLLVCGSIQSAFDFVLVVPAILLIYASVIGTALGVMSESWSCSRTVQADLVRGGTGMTQVRMAMHASGGLLGVIALGVGLWAWRGSRDSMRGESALAQTSVAEYIDSTPSAQVIEDNLRILDRALEHDAGWASLYARRATWRTLDYRRSLLEGAAAQGTTLTWKQTEPDVLFAAIATKGKQQRELIRRDLLASEQQKLKAAGVLVDHARSLQLSPFQPQTHLHCAALSPLVNMPVHRWTRSAASLNHNSHRMLFVNGSYAAMNGDLGMALDQWQKSLAISQQYIEPIYLLALPRMTPLGLATQIVPSERPDMLLRLLRSTRTTDPDSLPRLAAEMINHVSNHPGIAESRRHATVAQIHELMDRDGDAARSWQMAVDKEKRNLDFRWSYAQALCAIGMHHQALDQIALGQALRPEDQRFVRLASQIRKEIGHVAGH